MRSRIRTRQRIRTTRHHLLLIALTKIMDNVVNDISYRRPYVEVIEVVDLHI